MTELKMTAYEQKNMPLEVRGELQKYGYIMAPDSLMWIVLQAPTTAPLESISLRYEIEGVVIEDKLMIPQIQESTTHSDSLPHP